MKLGVLSNSDHKEFAENLAKEFINSFPPELARHIANKKNQVKFRKTINKIGVKARDYRKAAKLGVYGKAKIGNTFMWMLKEQGYDEKLVESITNDLLHVLD